MILRALLLVDEDLAFERTLCDVLRSWRVLMAVDRDGALRAVRAHRPPVAAVSLTLPRRTDVELGAAAEGLMTLGGILAEAPLTKVIMLDGAPDSTGDRDLAVRAIAGGAHDVIRRDGDLGELAVVIERAFHRHGLELEGRRLAADAPATLRAVRNEAERRAVLDALARAGGNLSATARLLEVSRPTLYNLLRQHGIRTV
ncbi:MAG TPA: helix-turn-helix domain-containing protein [Azospirillum sp.]|nr:helix-turn-helix domain-containing protein [Azospirillum sp.]